MTKATQEQERIRKSAEKKPKHTRRVPSSTTCEHCGGRFWAPKGEVVCPHCGKRVWVEQGIAKRPGAFLRTYLEGLAVSGAFSDVQVHHPYPQYSRRSTGLSQKSLKVPSWNPHQERATEGQNRKKKLQEEAKSICGAERIKKPRRRELAELKGGRNE
jgi:hypothetical protein